VEEAEVETIASWLMLPKYTLLNPTKANPHPEVTYISSFLAHNGSNGVAS
jgi:hypothetical protein